MTTTSIKLLILALPTHSKYADASKHNSGLVELQVIMQIAASEWPDECSETKHMTGEQTHFKLAICMPHSSLLNMNANILEAFILLYTCYRHTHIINTLFHMNLRLQS